MMGSWVRRSAMRGISAGCARCCSAALALSRSAAPAIQPGVNRNGCQASPSRTARRTAASLLPPIQTGIGPLR